MINIHEEIDTLRKEVGICKKNISMNTDNSLENISLLNKELQSLSERGWKIYHKEGNSGGGQIKNSEGRTVIYYQNDDGYKTSLVNLQMDEPKIYKKWNKNYTNFETIYLGDKKFIWVEKAKDRKIDLILDKISNFFKLK
tara:strand:+ start:200 stop:619 length:420 start_codon:yes stop_codon:yes gene_type:complete